MISIVAVLAITTARTPFLAQGAFNRIDVTDSLTNYPVTDLIFTYKMPLKKNEEFVRLSMKVDKLTNK